jgi:hypothetical protein
MSILLSLPEEIFPQLIPRTNRMKKMRMTLFILQDLSGKNKCLPLTSQKLSRKVLKSARQGLRANNKRKEKSGIKHRSQN